MKAYRPWTPDQPYLLPPNPRDWLPEGHLAPFLLEVVESLDLSAGAWGWRSLATSRWTERRWRRTLANTRR